ncbi:MAG: hypothetical protein IME97_08030 [Proteobacteria bacterium]|nr:hypothetical protein [Pseudomonadota bacterium]
MKNSIAMTLVITAGIFSFVSGYSIGNRNDQVTMNHQTTASSSAAVKTADKSSAPAGGYGAPSVDNSSTTGSSSPGYGAPSPGYGAPPPSPGYGQ